MAAVAAGAGGFGDISAAALAGCRWLLIAVRVAAMLGPLLVYRPALAGSEFLLGPGDRVSVSVFKRSDLSGEFRVSPDGMLGLPYIGAVKVAGLSLAAARDAVTRRLREDAFLLDPRASVELVEAPPVFVSGDVARPGAYPFQFGMTVSRAVASAGGARAAGTDDINARVAVEQLRERVRLAQQTIGLALLRRARLVAERADQNDLAAPDDIARLLAPDQARQAVDSERALLRQRRDAFQSQIGLLNAETAGFRDEIAAMTAQTASKQRESELALQESQYVENLQKQGLTPRTSRVNELQRLAVQLDGERSQIEAAIAHARGELVRIAETVTTLTNQRQIDLLGAIKDADDSIGAAQLSIDEASTALAPAQLAALAPDSALRRGGKVAFAIDRNRLDPPTHIEAGIDTPLLPGDMVLVSLGASPRTGQLILP